MKAVSAGGNFASGILALAIAAVYKFTSIDYAASGAVMKTESSGAYTDLLAWSMAFCGAICILRALLGLKKNNGAHHGETKRILTKKILLSVVSLAVYVIIMPWLGFIFSSCFEGIALLYILGERNPIKLIAIPCCWVAAIYVLFDRLLMIPLPLPFFL